MAFSSNDIYNDGTYKEKNPTWDDEFAPWKAAMVQEMINKNELKFSRLVEIGCGAGGILEYLQKHNPAIKSCQGYDISKDAIQLAQSKNLSGIEFINKDLLAEDAAAADLLLCIDVIEHIDDFYGFLEKLKNKSSQFIFHIPLDLSCRALLKPHVIYTQRELVGHIHYFSEEIALWALKDTGYEIVDLFYSKPIIDEENVKGLKANIKKVLRNFSYSINPKLSVKLWGGYSLMVLAK